MQPEPATVAATAPHPPLASYYAAPPERGALVRGLFNGTAPNYDRINRVFSLGSGAWYRRGALRRAGLAPGDRVLDIAVGTGLVAREAVGITGRASDVIGLDVSEGMLAEARRTLPIPLIQARAEALPVAGASIDFLSMGYALRHVADLAATFAEFRRVLRPGGRLLLLEIGRPDNRLAHAALRAYLSRIVPAICRLTAPRGRAGTLMHYYWDTIEACVPAEAILRHLAEAGFADVTCETQLGIFRAYGARCPDAAQGLVKGSPSAPNLPGGPR